MRLCVGTWVGVAQSVLRLRYGLEGPGIESCWGEIFRTLGPTQPPVQWVPGHRYHHPVLLSWNLGTLTSWNPLGHSRPVMGLLYLYLYINSAPTYHEANVSVINHTEPPPRSRQQTVSPPLFLRHPSCTLFNCATKMCKSYASCNPPTTFHIHSTLNTLPCQNITTV